MFGDTPNLIGPAPTLGEKVRQGFGAISTSSAMPSDLKPSPSPFSNKPQYPVTPRSIRRGLRRAARKASF